MHHRPATLAALVGTICLLSGCAVSRSPQVSQFANAFLPPVPAAVAPDPPAPAPPATQDLYKHEEAKLAEPVVLPARQPVDLRLQDSDGHFDTGRRLYQEGDLEGARREFDLAMETLLSAPSGMADRQRLERSIEQLSDAIFRYDVEGLGAGKSGDEIAYDQTPFEEILDRTFPVDPNLAPKVRGELSGTVSQLPLEMRDPVLAFIHYFSTDHGRKALTAGLRRAGRYRPMIERILDEEGVPKELIFLAQEESGFLPRARSNKACVGMWQFAQFRGREYNLNQTPYTDDRLDPEKATRAAAHHLHDLYRHLGDWYLAMAAYDCGPNCVDRAVARTGYADFWELHRRNALPHETMNYVPLILAMTIMAKNPKDYGLEGIDIDPPLETDQVEIKASTSLALAADATGRTSAELEELNPSLLRAVAPEGFSLKVPKGDGPAMVAALGQVPLARRASWRLHRVDAGETLATIAKRYGSSAKAIELANVGMDRGGKVGDLVVVPASARIVARAATLKRASATRHSSRAVAKLSKTRRRANSGTYATASLRPLHHKSTITR